jgi:hypothetical protein
LDSAVGVKLNMPFVEIEGSTENRFELLLLTMNTTLCVDSFAGPGLIAAAQFVIFVAPLFSNTVSFGPIVNVGGWFTGITVI